MLASARVCVIDVVTYGLSRSRQRRRHLRSSAVDAVYSAERFSGRFNSSASCNFEISQEFCFHFICTKQVFGVAWVWIMERQMMMHIVLNLFLIIKIHLKNGRKMVQANRRNRSVSRNRRKGCKCMAKWIPGSFREHRPHAENKTNWWRSTKCIESISTQHVVHVNGSVLGLRQTRRVQMHSRVDDNKTHVFGLRSF